LVSFSTAPTLSLLVLSGNTFLFTENAVLFPRKKWSQASACDSTGVNTRHSNKNNDFKEKRRGFSIGSKIHLEYFPTQDESIKTKNIEKK